MSKSIDIKLFISTIIAALYFLTLNMCSGYTQQIDPPRNVDFEEQAERSLIIFENQCVKFVLNKNGYVESFGNKTRNIEYCANPGKNSFLSVIKDKQTYTPSFLSSVNQQLIAEFESLQLTAALEVKVFTDLQLSSYLELSFDEVYGLIAGT